MKYTQVLLFIFLQSAGINFLSNWSFADLTKSSSSNVAYQDHNADAIIGNWMSTDHNLEVKVYKEGEIFHAKIIWFKIEDTTRPMDTRTDDKNPNPALRHRKWLGMEVLRDLKYNVDENEWEGGVIYDAKHGKEWDSVAWINSQGLLDVKGYWIFKWISKSLTFNRVN